MRSNYWSCSKFADWLRGTTKPLAGTAEEWEEWQKAAQVKTIRYWLAEEGLDYFQNFINWPMNCINRILNYINNRCITKTHALTSNLKRGQWHEFEERLLHSAFDELVNFVEIEQAWMHVICSEQNKYPIPRYHNIFHYRWRSPEAGLAYLEWAASLKNEEDWMDKSDPTFGKPTPQALAAQETIKLYNWWKNERPKRLDPSDASGWSNYYQEKQKIAEANGSDPLYAVLGKHESTEDKERSRKILELCQKIEKEQQDEDTEMLIHLVKLRTSLWT